MVSASRTGRLETDITCKHTLLAYMKGMTRVVAHVPGGVTPQQIKTANQALIHQLICYSESRAKSMTDLTAKSIENLLNNHVEITQCK